MLSRAEQCACVLGSLAVLAVIGMVGSAASPERWEFVGKDRSPDGFSASLEHRGGGIQVSTWLIAGLLAYCALTLARLEDRLAGRPDRTPRSSPIPNPQSQTSGKTSEAEDLEHGISARIPPPAPPIARAPDPAAARAEIAAAEVLGVHPPLRKPQSAAPKSRPIPPPAAGLR